MSIYHKHHIVPRHMGGTDETDNLVEVSIEQHALLHKQLWEDLHHQEDYIAWQCLSGQISTQEATLSAIRLARQRYKGTKRGPLSEESKSNISKAKRGKTINYPKNRKSRSKEDKLAVAAKMTGKNNHFFGKKHTDETKRKISESVRLKNLQST